MTTSGSDPIYRYRPLRLNSVRILRLTPSASEDDPIRCTLSAYRLSDPDLRFEPLSYTWGDKLDVVKIYVGGNRASFSVTRSCFNALKSLRLPNIPRLLWIDAICIDQSNDLERSAQVQIMDQVYARGVRTLIYLGEATPGTEMLFDELEEADSNLDRPAPSPAIEQQLDELIARPWFRRVWVLQEAFLNESRLVICGRRQASWEALYHCSYGFANTRVTETNLPLVLRLHNWSFDSGSVWLALFNQLNQTRSLLASEPRDRIFALKALLGRNQNELNPLIDYELSVADILADVATKILNSVGLILLSAIRSPHNHAVASWIPDWTEVDHPTFTRTYGTEIFENDLEAAPLRSAERKYQ